MSKRFIWIVTVFMGLAMASLILVQAYWIKNAILVKEKQFNQLLTRSMIDITHEIERLEVAKIASRLNRPKLNDTMRIAPAGVGDNDFPNTNSGMEIKEEEKQDGQQWMKDRREFVDRIINNLHFAPPDIEKRFSQSELEEIIRNVLSESEIDLPFEYAVVRWNNDTAYRSPFFKPFANVEYYRIQLFPDEVNPNYLKLYFPDKQDFLFQSITYLAGSSLLLTLVILVSFAATTIFMFRQKRLSEIRSDFISNMTHELKTPISTISLASQMLGDKSIPVELKNIAQISKIILEECRRLGSQVEKVLQTSVFDKGKLKLRLTEVDMHEIITGVVDNFSIQVKSRNGKITTSLKAEKHELKVDHVHITNVMSNLLDNAIKYCSREPEIFVETGNKMEFLVITVRDNGIGISRNDQRRIFEKFYRVPTGNIHAVKGFGLGLSYVKMIAEAHGGYVEVESELYEGSAFKIFLPLKDIDSHAKD
jgi:two-component system, OmpR family, phosphate regulon sensor histidine kinase PhoR